MSKGKYFLKVLEKAVHNADEIFLDGKEISLVSPCCKENEVSHDDGSFVCEKVVMVTKAKKKIAHLFTGKSVKKDAPKKKSEKKVTKKVTKKATKKVTKKATKKVTKDNKEG